MCMWFIDWITGILKCMVTCSGGTMRGDVTSGHIIRTSHMSHEIDICYLEGDYDR